MGSNAHPKRVAKDPTQADGWGLLGITWHQLVIATSFGDRVEDSELKTVVKERNKGSFPQGLNILLQDLRARELPNGWRWGCIGSFSALYKAEKAIGAVLRI